MCSSARSFAWDNLASNQSIEGSKRYDDLITCYLLCDINLPFLNFHTSYFFTTGDKFMVKDDELVDNFSGLDEHEEYFS